MARVSAKDPVDPTNPKSISGPYNVAKVTYDLDTDSKDPAMDKVTIYYPTGADTGYMHTNVTWSDSLSFPFISYAHGMFGGGAVEVPGYNDMLKTMSSFGYIVGATHQCSVGCFDDCKSLEHDPPCFGHYYKKQLGIFDFAKTFTGDASGVNPFKQVDWSTGVGVAGHSMGGQATLFSSSYDNATQYDIKAAVMHHAYTHSFPTPTVPFLDFTGEEDTTAPAASMGLPIFDAGKGAGVPRGLVDKTLAAHHEPDITCGDRNTIELLAQFSVAWFKLYLDQTPQAFGLDFDAMLYGQGSDGVCSGGDGQMTHCTIER